MPTPNGIMVFLVVDEPWCPCLSFDQKIALDREARSIQCKRLINSSATNPKDHNLLGHLS
jgi:hypothetical protein